jgi:hypothetical protein
MSFDDFIPSVEYQKFEDQHGEDTFIKLNLLYIAFEINELNDENIKENEFDDLCEDILEISLDESFEAYNIIDIADAVVFIIHDSNYSVMEYERVYKRNRDKICEELLAYLEKTKSEY